MVELEQQHIEQHDIADTYQPSLVARQKKSKGDHELERKRHAIHAGISDAFNAEAPPVFQNFRGAMIEALAHPPGTAEITQRFH